MSEYQAGLSRQEITAWEPEMRMWGWFMDDNRIKGVATPLYVRALVLSRQDQTLAYVCMDLGYVSLVVREVVLDILKKDHPTLGLGPHNVIFTATHTHSGPHGHSHVLGQSSTSFGFSSIVTTKVVESTLHAILKAYEQRVPVTLRVGRAEIPFEEKIAFNRSIRAYRCNPKVENVPSDATERATRRRSTTLRVDDEKGRMIGLVNWFGVHATCIHAENQMLHGDNKGLAAQILEEEQRKATNHPDFVAIFAQDAAGDVSPNFRYHRKRNKMIGISNDDDESARHNAEIHIRYAQKGAEQALHQPPLSGVLGGIVQHVDMAGVELDSSFTRGLNGQRTTHAIWGIMMPTGTAEGPGPMRPLLPLLRLWMRLRRLQHRLLHQKRDMKVPFLSLGLGTQGHLLHWIPTRHSMGWVGRIDPAIGYIHALYQQGLVKHEPWLPQTIPVQLLRIGQLALLGIPGEPTTMSGKCLRETLHHSLQKDEVTDIIINGYANTFAGYITTPEEYDLQEYEGSYTLFGKWTLSAYQQVAAQLARLPLASDPSALVEGPPIQLQTYEDFMKHRRVGRTGAWGPGAQDEHPESPSPFLQRLKRSLHELSIK